MDDIIEFANENLEGDLDTDILNYSADHDKAISNNNVWEATAISHLLNTFSEASSSKEYSEEIFSDKTNYSASENTEDDFPSSGSSSSPRSSASSKSSSSSSSLMLNGSDDGQNSINRDMDNGHISGNNGNNSNTTNFNNGNNINGDRSNSNVISSTSISTIRKRKRTDPLNKKVRIDYKNPYHADRLTTAITAVISALRGDPEGFHKNITSIAKTHEIPYNTLRDNVLRYEKQTRLVCICPECVACTYGQPTMLFILVILFYYEMMHHNF